jgi:DNA-directed RNA polymerase specialized sigma24 family protein
VSVALDMAMSRDGFPFTRWSVLSAAVSDVPEKRRLGVAKIAETYWRPLYVYLRIKHRLPAADAQDALQGFLAELWSGDALASFDPAKARFRTWLRVCLDHWFANMRRAERAEKRGGRSELISIDFAGVDSFVDQMERREREEPESRYEQEWIRALYEFAVEATRRKYTEAGKAADFGMFERYALSGESVSYEDLSRASALPVTTVTNRLAAVRRELRRAVLDQLRELTATEEEFRAEAERVLGIDPA